MTKCAGVNFVSFFSQKLTEVTEVPTAYLGRAMTHTQEADG